MRAYQYTFFGGKTHIIRAPRLIRIHMFYPRLLLRELYHLAYARVFIHEIFLALKITVKTKRFGVFRGFGWDGCIMKPDFIPGR